jgi:hypothetical protein
MKRIIFFTTLLSFGLTNYLQAQFTQVELFAGLDKTDFTLYSSYPIKEECKLHLATLAFFQKFNEKTSAHFNELAVQPTLFWNLNIHFSLGPSLNYNSVAGYSNRLSVKYTLNKARLLVVIIPSVGYSETNKPERFYAETFAQFQYNSPISNTLSLCINGQFLTVWNAFQTHTRSFQQLRTGVSIKGHQFGLGLDLDQYGPMPIQKSSFGLYYRKSL